MRHPLSFSRASSLFSALAVACLLAACDDTAMEGAGDSQLATVTRGDLRIVVTEGGDLASANPVVIRSPLEKRTMILRMVPEGTHVQKGDFLLELDGSDLEDRLNRAESDLERARSDVAQAKEALQIQLKKNYESIKEAETDLELAKRALKGYLESEYPLQKRRLESQLLLARAELARAKDRAEASARLFEKKFISRIEMEADELAHRRAKEEVDIAQRQLEQLENWTLEDQRLRLQTDLKLKEIALQRVLQQTESERAQKEDALAARRRTFELQQEARDKLRRQMDHVIIHAPASGLVVYAREKRRRYGQSEPISVGSEVREGEEIIRIPDLTNMVVEVDIHESSIKKIEPGQRALVRVDALPGEVLPGTVTKVSLVPSSQSSWMNPDLKVYTCLIHLDRTAEGVKPGMHAQAEILVAELKDVLQVPILAVHQVGKRSFVYLEGKDGRPELREVQVGENNDSLVQVVSGLQEGERVYVVPPPDGPRLPKPSPREKLAPSQGVPATTTGSPHRGAAAGAPHGSAGVPGGKIDPERARRMRERWAKMSPEERAKFMKKRGGRRRGTPPPTREN